MITIKKSSTIPLSEAKFVYLELHGITKDQQRELHDMCFNRVPFKLQALTTSLWIFVDRVFDHDFQRGVILKIKMARAAMRDDAACFVLLDCLIEDPGRCRMYTSPT